MNTKKLKVIGLFVVASAMTAIGAVATYSGIYNLKVQGTVLLAISKGGHLLSLDNGGTFANELNPSKSTVSATGKVVGASDDGLSVVAQIGSDFSLKGTAKRDGNSVRITGKRFLK